MFKTAQSKLTVQGNCQGFTLLEVLIAMAILAIGLLALGTMQISGFQGNAQAYGITEASTLAQNKMEHLISLSYTDSELDDTDGDGTLQDGDDDGTDDDGGEFGLGDVPGLGSLPQGGDSTPDHTEVIQSYTLYWNVAVDEPMIDAKRIRLFVQWQKKGRSHRIAFDTVVVAI